MKCHNCGRVFPTTDQQDDRLWAAAQALSDLMDELGMPRKLSPTCPHGYLQGNLDCCDKPYILWTEETYFETERSQ